MTTPHTPKTCSHAAAILLLVFNIRNFKHYSVSPAPGVLLSFTLLFAHIFVLFHLSLGSVRKTGVALGDVRVPHSCWMGDFILFVCPLGCYLKRIIF